MSLPSSRVRLIPRTVRGFASARDGAIAVMFALLVGALAGIMSLVYDLGRAWNLDTELQNAVDAAALAGATQLDGTSGARLRAVQAAISELAANSQKFADVDGTGTIVYNTEVGCTTIANCDGEEVTNENFQFYRSLNPKVVATTDQNAKFIEVTVQRTLRIMFGVAVGAPGSASPVSRAVAGYESFICGNMQLMMCNPSEDPSNEDLTAPFHLVEYDGSGNIVKDWRGAGVTLKEKGGGGQLFPGEFAWLSLLDCSGDDVVDIPQDCTVINDHDAVAQVNPAPTCVGTGVVLQTGTITDQGRKINMRLDIYLSGGYDYRSDPDYQPDVNFLTGLVPDPADFPAACNYNVTSQSPGAGGSALVKPANGYQGMQQIDGDTTSIPWHQATWNGGAGAYDFDPVLDHLGYTRDDCSYTDENGTPIAPGTDADGETYTGHCIFAPPSSSGITPGNQIGTARWDFETFMRYHHPLVNLAGFVPFDCGPNSCTLPASGAGPAGDSNGVNVDLDGNGRISRFELAQWESQDFDNNGLPDNPPKYGRQMCFDGGTPPLDPYDPDTMPARRMLGVAVGNCNAIAAAGGGIGKNKKKPLPLAEGDSAVNVFLTEALGELDPNAFYGELVEPNSEDAAVIVTNRIILYE